MGCLLFFIIFVSAFIAVNKFVCFWCRSKVCLVGKTALVTGGASGIGYHTALGLAAKGCRVIIADVVDTTKTVQDIIKQSHNPHIIGKKLNLESFQSVRNLVKYIYESEPRLDILVNNAGIGAVNITYTEDGLDKTMQTNYFGHFLLTHLLIDLLKKSSPSRIVFTSSVVAYVGTVKIENLNPTEEYGSAKNVLLGGTYGYSKLCQALAAKMFGEKLTGTGVTANVFNPGGTRTNIFFTDIKTWRDYYRICVGLFTYTYGKSAEEGAQTLIYLAHADEVKNITGKFFMEGRQIPHPFQSRDRKFCEELWKRSILYTKLEPHEIKC